VLFDLWFIAATAAVVMGVGRPLGWVIKKARLRRRKTP